jgi:RNA polymerase sigma-70 factor (ECF subfamily)
MDHMTDEQLVESLNRGDIRAIEELYRRWAKKLFLYFRHTLRTPDPEDLVHDVFLRVVEHSGRFDPGRALFRTWLFRIAHNLGIDVLRRNQHHPTVSIETSSDRIMLGQKTIQDDPEQVEESMDRDLVSKAVQECIDELANEQEKQALVLYYLVGAVYREIGETVGRSISMVKKRIESAKTKIKICLERKGIDSL